MAFPRRYASLLPKQVSMCLIGVMSETCLGLAGIFDHGRPAELSRISVLMTFARLLQPVERGSLEP